MFVSNVRATLSIFPLLFQRFNIYFYLMYVGKLLQYLNLCLRFPHTIIKQLLVFTYPVCPQPLFQGSNLFSFKKSKSCRLLMSFSQDLCLFPIFVILLQIHGALDFVIHSQHTPILVAFSLPHWLIPKFIILVNIPLFVEWV